MRWIVVALIAIAACGYPRPDEIAADAGVPDASPHHDAPVLQPPTNLGYTNPTPTYFAGVAIANDTPTSQGGSVASYAISPALSPGLGFNTSSGVISGTPTQLRVATSYTVTASNAAGSTTATLLITVEDAPPTDLAYSKNPAVYTRGFAIAPNLPTSSGGAVIAYSVAPALPAGLALNTATGLISGTPSIVVPTTSYLVTAQNSSGSASVALSITVTDTAPNSLTYFPNPAVYTKNTMITPNVPASGGGAIASYAVSPPLPPGLALDTTTGVISGTPTAVVASAAYVVTGMNAIGSATANLTITVNDAAPAGLTYTMPIASYTKGTAIADNFPMETGGAVALYAVAPALPAGLALDALSGVISGTPTAISPTASYTVTGSNASGSATATLSIAVTERAPSNLTYTTTSASYTVDTAISPDMPSWSGGMPTAYSISPGLPPGLLLDTSTGIISGTPTTAATIANYIVTATNSGGSAFASLTITVNNVVAPSNLSYTNLNAIYTTSLAIPPNVPSSSGGAVVAYSVAPALPVGLQLSASTGTITGTPTVATPLAAYVVTATNSAGSTTITLSIIVNPLGTVGLDSVISVGGTHACALASGTVQCWGGNLVGQLGNNTTAASATPVFVTGIASGAQAVSAGQAHTCAIVNGGVSCWGSNANGQLGDGTTTGRLAPVPVFGLAGGVQALAAGLGHTCAIVNGGVQCWGSNATGQLGNNSRTDSSVPVQVSGLTSGVQAIAAGNDHTCALVNGAMWCWGANDFGQLGNNSTVESDVPVQVSGLTGGVQAIAAGWQQDCALVNGAAWCWGNGSSGQLGSAISGSTVPIQVPCLASGVQAIASGAVHVCAMVNGGIQCWGNDGNGQLGNNATTNAFAPVAVVGVTAGAQSLVAGYFGTCGLVNGGVQCWGQGNSGQLGNGFTSDSHVPVPVAGLTAGLQAIAVGGSHTCALVNGGAQCWGSSDSGQLGDNSLASSAVPVHVSGLASGVQAISAGGAHTCALANGGVQCWGSNQYGQLGNNSTTDSPVPVPVVGLTTGVQRIVAMGTTTCAVVNGGAQCWGQNTAGQLGNNSTTNSLIPVSVSGLATGVQAIAGGSGSHVCAIANGGAVCWGSNSNGQLGNGSMTGALIPVAVTGLTSGVEAIAVGQLSTCALVKGGVQCWGANDNGELGNNTVTTSSAPVAVVGASSGVQAITAGVGNACALGNGGARCWGANTLGECGNGSIIENHHPAQVVGIVAGAQAIGANGTHGCAIAGSNVECWGDNTGGDLGNNSTSPSTVPVFVGAWAP